MQTFTIEHYLNQITKESIDKDYYRDMIIKYRTECGCSLSASFLMLAIVGVSIYVYLSYETNELELLELSLYSIGFIFLSAFIGKALGLGLAKIKLNLLYKELQQKNM